jgi:hypothetical protein
MLKGLSVFIASPTDPVYAGLIFRTRLAKKDHHRTSNPVDKTAPNPVGLNESHLNEGLMEKQ